MVISTMACGHARPVPAPTTIRPVPSVRLVVLPAESDAFPAAARELSARLAAAKVPGVDDTQVSKVSLEVVQLSVECVEPTNTCYDAIGRSMAVDRLLFARLDPGGKRQLKVTVTLYDVDAKAAMRTATKLFTNEAEASSGVAALVDEVAR
jgi:hypothetical protein